jgi:phospho-N-acetylmuramoyl-pentapeptide-transferase
MATALVMSLLLGPPVIRWLRRLRVGQVVRAEGPQSHLIKAGTPTMGGALIIMSTVIATLLWAELTNGYVIVSVIVLVWLGSLGFLDDYLKVVRKPHRGAGRPLQAGRPGLLGLLVAGFLLYYPPRATCRPRPPACRSSPSGTCTSWRRCCSCRGSCSCWPARPTP